MFLSVGLLVLGFFSLPLYLFLGLGLRVYPLIINYVRSSVKSLQENPILIAVSNLSPVNTQILIPAFFKSSIVSPTLSYSLSSIAVAPNNVI